MSNRTTYFRDYYNKRVKTDSAFYEKEKLRIAEYIKNRKMIDPEYADRLKEHRRQYRLRKRARSEDLGDNTNLSNILNTSNSGIA
jgi:hypothetical protein